MGNDPMTAAVLAAANEAAEPFGRRVQFEVLGGEDGLAIFPGDGGGDAGGIVSETRDIAGGRVLRRRYVCRLVWRSAGDSEAARMYADGALSSIADGVCERLRASMRGLYDGGARLLLARRGTPHKNESEKSGVSDRVVLISAEYYTAEGD